MDYLARALNLSTMEKACKKTVKKVTQKQNCNNFHKQIELFL